MLRMDPFEAARWRLRRPTGWRAALLVALAVAVMLALIVVATSLMLIITPIVLAALLARRFLGGRTPWRDAADDAPGRPRVIEADYEVIVADSPADRGPPEPGEDRPRSG
jgi:hypothetical protein